MMLYVVAGELLFAIATNPAGEWPQWRGPDRANRSAETGLLQSWPTNGPPLLWKATGLGTGIASVSVADGRVYTVGYRDGGEFVFALDIESGESRWTSRVGPEVLEQALMRWLSQRSPTVDEDRVYTTTASGELFCLRTANGDKVWQKSYPKDFASPRPVWGFGDRPLVDGEKLICAPAGTNASVVALNKRTGQTIWSTVVPGIRGEGYAATVISEAGGIRQYLASLRGGLIGIAADDGRILWRSESAVDRYGGSYTPIVQGDWVFSANGYGVGMILLKLARDGSGIVSQEEYRRQLGFFNPFQDATVLVGNHVYAFEATGRPVCIEMSTGQLAWGPITNAVRDRAALTYADGHLYIRRASGLMALAEASPKSYVEKGSFQIPDREEASGVTSPVIAGGRLYLRDNSQLLCYDVSADALAKPPSKSKTVAVSLTPAQTRASQDAVTTAQTGKDRTPDAIFVPTPDDVVERMLELAQVKKENLLLDLGSGDGRIVIAAARKYGSRAVGYEIDERLVRESREKVKQAQVEQLVRVEHEDIFTVDLSGADIIAVYLPSPLLERLIPQLEKLKPGSRIVSHQFMIPGVRADQTVTMQSREDGDTHRIYLWTAPLRKL
jgi:outer membrane protein assembly factor BamB/protein-L-isoaspartate O-methyltransferase